MKIGDDSFYNDKTHNGDNDEDANIFGESVQKMF